MGILILLTLFGLLPPPAASALGGWLGRVIGPRLAVSRKAYRHVMTALPGRDDYYDIIRDMWDNLGRVVAEYPHLKTIAQRRTDIRGTENIPANKACIFIGGHLANWEINGACMLIHQNSPLHLVYRAPNNPFIAQLLDRYRSLKGRLGTIPKSSSGARDLVNVLQAGEPIGILIDQKYNEGIAIPFFGQPAMTSPAFVKLAQKFNVPIVPVHVQRDKGCYFHITVEPPLDIKNKSLEDIMIEAHQIFRRLDQTKPGAMVMAASALGIKI